MDCTLRDGSYAVDFQFTAKFTASLSRVLDDLGFDYIEVGHGIGIGASDKIRRAAATDIQYARAANSSVKKSKWGMFAIPNIATPSLVDQLFDEEMDFIRVGIDALELHNGLNFIYKSHQTGATDLCKFHEILCLKS